MKMIWEGKLKREIVKKLKMKNSCGERKISHLAEEVMAIKDRGASAGVKGVGTCENANQ